MGCGSSSPVAPPRIESTENVAQRSTSDKARVEAVEASIKKYVEQVEHDREVRREQRRKVSALRTERLSIYELKYQEGLIADDDMSQLRRIESKRKFCFDIPGITPSAPDAASSTSAALPPTEEGNTSSPSSQKKEEKTKTPSLQTPPPPTATASTNGATAASTDAPDVSPVSSPQGSSADFIAVPHSPTIGREPSGPARTLPHDEESVSPADMTEDEGSSEGARRDSHTISLGFASNPQSFVGSQFSSDAAPHQPPSPPLTGLTDTTATAFNNFVAFGGENVADATDGGSIPLDSSTSKHCNSITWSKSTLSFANSVNGAARRSSLKKPRPIADADDDRAMPTAHADETKHVRFSIQNDDADADGKSIKSHTHHPEGTAGGMGYRRTSHVGL